MSEQTAKKERFLEVMNEILNQLPPLARNMIPVFVPQFQQLSTDNIPDEAMEGLLSLVKSKLDYIEKGA